MVTTKLPVVAPVGTGTAIEPELQMAGVELMLLKETVLPFWPEPKPVPVIVIDAPTAPEAGDKLVMFGTTANCVALLAAPPTVTTTVPVPPVAPTGTDAVMDVALQFIAAVATPLNVTVLPPCRLPNPDPVMVTEVPAIPDVADKPMMLGTTVKATPLLGPPFTVTTTFPVVAAAGTVTAIDVDFQLVGVAAAPLNVTVLLPCNPPNPVPVRVTAAPTMPDVIESEVMVGRAVPVPVRLTVCGLLLALSVMVSVPG
jgi:hypothetical protein